MELHARNQAQPLGNRSGRIKTHCSQAELSSLIEAADKVCETESRKISRSHLASAHDRLAKEGPSH